MKSTYFSIFAIIALGISCTSKKPDTNDPKSKLEQLRTQEKEIQDQIKQLEAQLALSDSTNTGIIKAKLVSIDSLRKQVFQHYIEVQGMVDAKNNILATPQMPAVVTGILVKVGDFVNAGKVLATLDGNTIRKGIEEVKTGLALANTMYDKQKKLWDQNIGSEAQYLQAKNMKEQQEQRLQTMQAQLAMTLIKAPVSGTVDEVNLKLGEMASPGMAGIRVVNNKELTIKAKVSDLYASKIKKGDRVKLYFPDLDKEMDSFIKYSGQTVNSINRTITIECALPKTNEKLIANQIVKLKINDKILTNVLVISTNLIQKSIDGEDYVLVAEQKNGKWFARKKIVKVGLGYNGQSVIEEGLKVGDLFIASGYNEIVDGQLIQI
ncbi:MAG: efflux RND transporter periplasmic adaptor subunit [Bacteroidota bacterium]|nr:efflux RND transporter periplasmic adaptor subunit [Bacteroidota bacterium]